MKVERVSEHIWTARFQFLLPIRVWLVVAADGVTLVDTGLSFLAAGILKAIDSLHAGPLRQILLTHGHGDHIGGVTRILNSRPVPVYAHERELPCIEGALPYPGRKKPERRLPAGLVEPLAGSSADSLDVVAGLKPYRTHGHSPGHVVYYHEQDRTLLAGDQFGSRNGQLRPPIAMFTPDMAEALRSRELLRQLQPERLEITHGGPVFRPAEQLAV